MSEPLIPPTRPLVSDSLISVVLPVYNESAVLMEICQRLRAALTACRTTFEIIFVDDGSSDGGAEALDRLSRQFEEVRVVHLSRNFGHQAAIHAGLLHARGDAVVLMDSDLQDPPEAIGKFLEAWQSGYDVAYAVRIGRKEWLGKRVLFAGFHRLLSSISSTPIPVDAGNFSLLDARVVRHLASLGECDRYLPGLRSWVGFTQIGIPVERGSRYDERPRVSLRGLLRLAKTAIFSFSSLPLAMFSWLGWMALAVFLAVSSYSLYCRLFTSLAIPGWTSQLVTMSFFAALNALGISMLGEYVVRIYDQVRGRPLYLVDRTVNFATDACAVNNSDAPQRRAEQPKGVGALDLERLDPLEVNSEWDGAYQHLLAQANDLLELGALAQADAEELARRSGQAGAQVSELTVLKFSDAPGDST
ncbi:MAG TPA: glycosyltransferase family 2 protein [Pirellulales bacterium]|nr:glycosyltransferase family 2 protein [Pirellulales bacterium]